VSAVYNRGAALAMRDTAPRTRARRDPDGPRQARLTVRLTRGDYDRLAARADRARTTPAALLRGGMRLHLLLETPRRD
jgi:hypothetical protein